MTSGDDEQYNGAAARLSEHIAERELLLAHLPAKADRSANEATEAERIRRECQDARAAFLAAHAPELYRRLTDDLRRPLRVDELAEAAAELLPGLVPTPKQLAEERAVIQANKEGREVELGMLFAAILRLHNEGTHLIESMLQPTRAAVDALPGFRRTGVADFGTVLVERKGDAAWLTLRNLPYLNAEDDDAVAALEAGVDLVLLDEDVKVGVLRGDVMHHARYAGRRIFSAGINLTRLRDGQISLVDFMLRRELGYINKILRGAKPWLALVEGFAIGGGAQQLLVFDRVIAARDAYFSLPALTEGIIPGLANLRLSRFVGARAARRMIMWDAKISAEDSEAAMLCDEAVDPDQIEAAADRAVERLANPAVIANRRMLTLAEEPLDAYRRYIAEYAIEQAQLLYSENLRISLERTWTNRAASKKNRT